MTGRIGFSHFLSRLGFPASQLEGVTHIFNYPVQLSSNSSSTVKTVVNIEFVYLQNTPLAETHLRYWNHNELEILVAVTDTQTFVIDPKAKPRFDEKKGVLQSSTILNFDYGVNSKFDSEDLKGIRRQDIDNTEFFNAIYERQRSSRNSVNKDLLLNLIALRNDLTTKKNEHSINVLILRCLFIKYLEDRRIIDEENFLVKRLKTGNPKNILRAFSQIRKINGDLFQKSQLDESLIKPHILEKLERFFSCYNYADGQGTFFPYQFDKIPVEVISNIYEAFLKDDERKKNSVYYTPQVLVRFMIGQALDPVIRQNQLAKVLDPACGSGSYLVEAYKRLITVNDASKSFNKKVDILRNQIFGIDIDESSLVIAAFSLYLTLLEDIKPEFVRKKIIEKSPLLPSLLNRNLIHANALVDNVQFGEGGFFDTEGAFDCILANPPWGSADDNLEENKRIRKAIGGSSKKGTVKEYDVVSDFQKSQAFLLRTLKWSHGKTRISFVVNNSIFFNEKAANFRQRLLDVYTIDAFYECSEINKILFRQHTLGKLRGEEIKVGANEPCSILFMRAKPAPVEHTIKFTTPRLTQLSEHFNIIHFSDNDVKPVFQVDLKNEDLLWRVFVHGNWKSYQLIKHCYNTVSDNLVTIECRSGFKAESEMKSTGKPVLVPWIDIPDFKRRYSYTPAKRTFNWSQKLERKRVDEIFEGERILFPVRPLLEDDFKLKGVLVNLPFAVHKDNISAIRFKSNEAQLSSKPYIALMNSALIGYILYHVSPQWGKGDTRRGKISNSIVEGLPIPYLPVDNKYTKQLTKLVEEIIALKNQDFDADISLLEKDIDEITFKLYGLKDYDIETIREFQQVRVIRRNLPLVSKTDLDAFATKFKSVFSFMVDEKFALDITYDSFHRLAIVMRFKIVPKGTENDTIQSESMNFLAQIKQKQIKTALREGLLNEQTIPIYGPDCFYLIKPCDISYWSVKQAIDDANVEIGKIVKSLPV